MYREKEASRIAEVILKVYLAKYNDKHDDLGRFASGGASASGANVFKVQGFANKQKLNNHWQDHQKEYPGWTKKQYETRALELVQSPVGGDIFGHKDGANNVIRYDIKTNDFAKGNPDKAIRTLFKPKEGLEYYNDKRREDLRHGGKG